MNTLPGLQGTLSKTSLSTATPSPCRPGSGLSLPSPSSRGHTLSPSSSNSCFTTFYSVHVKCHLVGKACPDEPSPTRT